MSEEIKASTIDEATFVKLIEVLQKTFPYAADLETLIPALRYTAQIMEEVNTQIRTERTYH